MTSMDTTQSSITTDNSSLIDQPPPTRAKKILRISAWVFFGLFCLIFFTLIKLPDDRIKSIIDGNISAALAQKGITYTANEGHISFFLGLTYKMKDITLHFPPPAPPTHIEQIKVSPSLFALIFGKVGGTVQVKNAGGSLDASFSANGSKVAVSFKSDKLDLGKLGVLPIAANIQGGAVIDGHGSIDGDINIPSTLNGEIAVNLTKIQIDSQAIMGFTIPKISIADGVAEVALGQGKATLKTVRLGKTGSTTDDIRGTISGDIALNKSWDSSTLNLKTRFSLSEGILKSFMLLDAILGSGKQADGSYAFSLTGPTYAPMPTPIPPGGS